MISQLGDLNQSIDANVESLMKLSELNEDWKLTDINDGTGTFNIAPWSLFRDLGRLGKNYSTRTRVVLERLYHEVEKTTNQILQSVHLNVVLLPNKNQISYSENELFLFLRRLVEQQTLWVEKSMVGLQYLDKSYGGKEKKFAMLIARSNAILQRVRGTLHVLDEAHARLDSLHVLALNSDQTSEMFPPLDNNESK